MKRFLPILIALATTTALSAQNTASGMMPGTVMVSGTGRSSVAPDRFSFNVGVQTMANTVDDAVAENNRRVSSVIAVLKKAGATEKEIQTSGFSIWPQQDFKENSMPRVVGYQVSNSITVRSSKVGDVGRYLGVAVGAGVNTASGINFEVADPAKGRDQGLKNAFEDARAKASLLAESAGRKLGRTLSISEGSAAPPPQPYPIRAMAMEAKVSGEVPVEAGMEEKTYTVTVLFELQ
jgi:uncharacterized protein YggE